MHCYVKKAFNHWKWGNEKQKIHFAFLSFVTEQEIEEVEGINTILNLLLLFLQFVNVDDMHTEQADQEIENFATAIF
ncbi:hypothetical protein T4B_9515 [Trichinella pseudospiralis]|uniref:Uncharacterized protein n=1 Tax=Trichinella pseudospiralis TaxID=6337 RepID=A0A0V1J468_TRIPS|nr:hypothetical protein T4B_9515 [Trichinella pseudospiralis]KRZ29766.1 hypothetical protein T4C_4212 [Trichinella pseudospiralis]